MYECSLYVHYRTCNFAQLSLQNMELHRVSYQITSVYNQFAFSKFKLISVRNIIERVLMICHIGCHIRSFYGTAQCFVLQDAGVCLFELGFGNLTTLHAHINYNTGQALTSRRRVECSKPCQIFIHLQGLGASQLIDHLANEINQGRCYVR